MKKTYKVGTSQSSFMILAILFLLILVLIFIIYPSALALLKSRWFQLFLIIVYFFLFIATIIKGEKLSITSDSLHLKGWFINKKLRIDSIDSYKVMSSSYTGNTRVIAIYPKNKNHKIMLINYFPNNDFTDFINWLENELEKNEVLQIDPVQKQILSHKNKFSVNLLEKKSSLKSYKVGKSFTSIYLSFLLVPLSLVLSYFLSEIDFINSHVLMYLQIGGVVIFMIGYIAYTMFFHNKIIISKDAIRLKGLFKDRELKFLEIKGYKTSHTFIKKYFKHIRMIPNTNSKKEIVIYPSGNIDFIELTDWIENNFNKVAES